MNIEHRITLLVHYKIHEQSGDPAISIPKGMYGDEFQANKRCQLHGMAQRILVLIPIIPFEQFSKKRINFNRELLLANRS